MPGIGQVFYDKRVFAAFGKWDGVNKLLDPVGCVANILA